MHQAAALALTLAVELPVAAALLCGRVPPGRALAVAATCSLLSHPAAWWANGHLPLDFWPRAALIEGGVVAVEALLYTRLAPVVWPRAALTSALANGASFGAGLLWWWLARSTG